MASSMGGSTIVRQQGVKASDAAGLINHHFRDVDRENGKEVNHSNVDIVADLTPLNTSWVNDGQGGFKDCENTDEVRNYIEERLSSVKKRTRKRKDGSVYEVATRKDFPVLRDWVLALDPDAMEHYRELMEAQRVALEDGDQATVERLKLAIDDERAEIRRLLGVMTEKVTAEVGQSNVVGGSMHWDETNPHVQLLTLPIDGEGKLNWKGFRCGHPEGLVAFHDDMRATLRAAGYNAFDERISGVAKHLGLAKLKQTKDALRAADDVILTADEHSELVQENKRLLAEVKRLPDLEEREKAVAKREAAAAEHEEALVLGSAQLDERSAAIDVRSTEVDKKESSVDAAALALERARRQQLEDLAAEAERIKAEATAEAQQIKQQAEREASGKLLAIDQQHDAARSYLERIRKATTAAESLLEQVSSSVTREQLQDAADEFQERYGDLLGGIQHDEGKHYGG